MKANDRLRFDRTLSTEKRVETGSYYTPPEMAEMMVCLALACTLSRRLAFLPEEAFFSLLKADQPQRREALLETLTDAEKELISRELAQMTVLDLSAGSGIFPLSYMKVLKRWFDDAGLWTAALAVRVAGNLHVIDIQPEPLALYAEEMKLAYDTNEDQLSLYCLDALDDEALNRHEQLAVLMDQGVDLVLGNPPYLGEKNHKELFQRLRNTSFGSRYYEGRMDYFFYFIYRGIESLKPGGQLCYITTNYFATADGAKGLRAFLQTTGSFRRLVNFNDCALFKDALGQHNVVFVYEKAGFDQSTALKPDKTACTLAYPLHKAAPLESLYEALSGVSRPLDWAYDTVSEKRLYDFRGMLKIIPSEGHQPILDKLRHDDRGMVRKTLGEAFYVQQGIVSGFDRDFKQNKGVFVLTKAEALALPELARHLKPFYKNKQIRKYQAVKPADYEILYLFETMEELEAEQGPVFQHLAPHRERLALRREVVKRIRPWYALQWPREPWRFEGPVIAAPQRAFVNVFAFEAEELYGSADIYYIADRDKTGDVAARTLWMTAYLNSPIVYFWLSLMGKRKGSMLELYATPLKSIPIPDLDLSQEIHQAIVSDAVALVAAKQQGASFEKLDKAYLSQIHQRFYELMNLSDSESRHIESYYEQAGAKASESSYWGLKT